MRTGACEAKAAPDTTRACGDNGFHVKSQWCEKGPPHPSLTCPKRIRDIRIEVRNHSRQTSVGHKRGMQLLSQSHHILFGARERPRTEARIAHNPCRLAEYLH